MVDRWTQAIKKCVVKYHVAINDTNLLTEFELKQIPFLFLILIITSSQFPSD